MDLEIYTVGGLTRWIRELLEEELDRVWVEGEISACKIHRQSGHAYFNLKDEEAVLKCVAWASAVQRMRVQPRDGLQVRALGRVSVYEARGEYQLYVDRLVETGEGALQAAFLQLKARLDAEGLFASERKKPIPQFPRRLALVTSTSGAALGDMTRILADRWPAIRVYVWPAVVQGEEAIPSIVEGLQTVDRLGFDVIVVGRGGGSLEDLWAFNEEPVARAIAACRTPVVSAVGHEIDTTISDFVADVRATTPTNAAEIVVPDVEEILVRLGRDERSLRQSLQGRLESLGRRILRASSSRALMSPETRLHRLRLDLDLLAERLREVLEVPVVAGRGRLEMISRRFQTVRPDGAIASARGRWEALADRFEQVAVGFARARRDRLAVARAGLLALGPHQVLARGYSIVRNGASGAILREAGDIEVGDSVNVTLHAGGLECTVEERTLAPGEDS